MQRQPLAWIQSKQDGAYNQLCSGEMSAEWSQFGAQGPFCLNLAQQVRVGERTDVESGAQTYRSREQPVEHGLEGSRQSALGKGEEEGKEEEEETEVQFHCPWVGCHHVSYFPFPCHPCPINFDSVQLS